MNEPSDVARESNSNKVVHLEEEPKCALLELVDDREQLDHLVHGGQTQVDKQQPVHQHHVVSSVEAMVRRLCVDYKLLIVVFQFLVVVNVSGLFETKRHESEEKPDRHRRQLV